MKRNRKSERVYESCFSLCAVGGIGEMDISEKFAEVNGAEVKFLVREEARMSWMQQVNGGLVGQVDVRALDRVGGCSGGQGLCVKGSMMVIWGIHEVEFVPDFFTRSSLQLHVLLTS